MLNKKPLQPLYGIAQPVSLHIHVGNFQQGRPAPIYRCVGAQVLLVNRDGIVRLFHFTQDIAVKISRARGENRVRDPPGQLHKIRRPAQRLIETFLGKIHRGEQVILLPKPLRGQAFVRKVFEQQPRRTKLLQLKVPIGQKQATVDDKFRCRRGIGGFLKRPIRRLQRGDQLLQFIKLIVGLRLTKRSLQCPGGLRIILDQQPVRLSRLGELAKRKLGLADPE